MVYEKLDFSYDIEKLKKHLQDHVLNLPITEQSSFFGGWSVTSSTGDFRDGWSYEGRTFIENNHFATAAEYTEALKKQKILTSFDHKHPTEICHGYFMEIIEDLQERGLKPRRVRVIRLHSQSSSTWHRDLPDHIYGVRLHIPIITNPHCFFECEAGKEHLVADGSAYLLKVNRMHRVINNGDTHRYNLVMDVTDTLGISKHHRFNKDNGSFPLSIVQQTT